MKNYGNRFKEIYFFKCPKVADLSALSLLTGLEVIKYYWNNSAGTLWDMSGNVNLRRVELMEFFALSNLFGVKGAKKLKNLSLTAYSKNVLDVSALAGSSVGILDVTARLEEISAYHFSQMPCLEALFLHPRILETQTFAWLTANLKGVRSETLYPYVKLNLRECDEVMICGKRKPSLCLSKSAKKIEEYKRKFYEQVQKYTGVAFFEAFPEQKDRL